MFVCYAVSDGVNVLPGSVLNHSVLSTVGVQSHVCLSAGPAAPPQMAQSSQSSFYSVLLRSGAVCLPGELLQRSRLCDHVTGFVLPSF